MDPKTQITSQQQSLDIRRKKSRDSLPLIEKIHRRSSIPWEITQTNRRRDRKLPTKQFNLKNKDIINESRVTVDFIKEMSD